MGEQLFEGSVFHASVILRTTMSKWRSSSTAVLLEIFSSFVDVNAFLALNELGKGELTYKSTGQLRLVNELYNRGSISMNHRKFIHKRPSNIGSLSIWISQYQHWWFLTILGRLIAVLSPVAHMKHELECLYPTLSDFILFLWYLSEA